MKINIQLATCATALLLLATGGCHSSKKAANQKNYLNETQAEHDQRMEWWREARFGMFIHWGLYAVPAGKWGEKDSYGEWIRTTAEIPLTPTTSSAPSSTLRSTAPRTG